MTWNIVFSPNIVPVSGGGGGSVDDAIPGSKVIWVDNAAANDSGSGASASPKKTIAGAYAAINGTGGWTIVLKAGTYAGTSNDLVDTLPQVGVSSGWNEIRAEVDGTVTITATLNIYHNADLYTKFTGLIWSYADDKGIQRGKYWKFKRCRFIGGRSSGNYITFAVGTNDASPGTQYGLLEDCWAYGPGGRYKILIYNSDRIIVRRAVTRHDGGWTNVDSNPQGNITFYNSSNCINQNSIAIDTLSSALAQNYEAGFYNVSNGSSSNGSSSNKLRGVMAIRTGGGGIAWDDHVVATGMTLQDFLIWNDVSGDGFTNNGEAHVVNVSRGLIKSSGTGAADYNDGSSITCSRLIMYGNTTKAFRSSLSGTSTVCNGNGDNTGGTSTINPTSNGLLYPTRIEASSTLETLGTGSVYVGPQIRNKIGVDGTLWGETGYDDDTGNSLWPFPYESIIKSEMGAISGGNRGYCLDTSLTHYIMNLLSNGNPY